jgi:hypothetical protein
MHCFICERFIEVENDVIQNATIWQTHGNYGSQAYDSLSENRHLEIAVCDDCFATRKSFIEEVVTIREIRETSRHPIGLEWTEDIEERRNQLMNKEIDGLLTAEEKAELRVLDSLSNAHFDRIADPLRIKEGNISCYDLAVRLGIIDEPFI